MLVELQPSSSSRWLVCTASPGFIARHADNLPAESDTSYSREGTLAHELASTCILMGFDPALFDDVEMANHVKGYVETIQGWAATPNSTLYVERAVPLFYSPTTRKGTRDACVVADDSSWLRVGDLKYGAGVSVQAKKNPQLAIYAMSTILELEATGLYSFADDVPVTIMIYQPRVIGERAVRLWVPTVKELREFCAEIELTALTIDSDPHNPELVFAPGDKTCQFCPAVALCSARAGQLLGGVEVESVAALTRVERPSTPVFPSPERLTLAQLSKIVAIAPQMRTWLDNCETLGEKLLHQDKPFPGFKLVEGRSNRKWADPAQAELSLREHLGEEVLTKAALKSPAQIEELVKLYANTLPEDFDALLSSLILKPKGNPTMVPESDRRPRFCQNPADFFEDLTQDTGLLG